jgi:hypothetical protein
MATGYAFILMLGLLFYTFSLPLSTYDYVARIEPYPPTSHNAVLSEENPVFRHNISSSFEWIEIVHLSTNSTPVSLHVLDGTGTLLNVTNMTSLSGFSLTVARTGFREFWLEVVRQHSDANISITLRGWRLVPPPTFDVVAILSPIPLVAVLAFLYSFYKLVRITQYEARRGPATIILLLILGATLIMPLVQSTKSHDFEPTYDLQTSHEHYLLSLNESQLSSSSSLGELSPEGTSWVLLKAHNFSASNYPFLVRVTDEFEHEIILENVNSSGLWWLSFAESTNRSTLLTFERIDTDIELQFTIEASYRILVEGADPFIPTVLALIGTSLSILAIGLAVRLDWSYSRRSSRVTLHSSISVK